MCPYRNILIYKIELLLAEIGCRTAGWVSVSTKPRFIAVRLYHVTFLIPQKWVFSLDWQRVTLL